MDVQNPFPPFNRIKQCRYGTFLYNIHDFYIGKALDLYGEYCESEIALFAQVLNSGDWALDIGANLGTHTVYMAQKVGVTGRVFGFEPQRIVFQSLCANIALNNIINTQCYQAGLADHIGQIQVPPVNYYQDNNFGALSLKESGAGETVPLMTVDSLQLARCDFMKIDVEGMELSVLSGAQETLERCRPILFVENDRVEKSPALIDFLFSKNYGLYWAIMPLYNPKNFANNPQNIYNRTVAINMLCYPKERRLETNLPLVTSANDHWQDHVK